MNVSLLAAIIVTASIPASCNRPDTGDTLSLDQLVALDLKETVETSFFQEGKYALCIVDEGDATPAYGSLAAAMQRNHCTAGVNGGYFRPDAARTPLGLVKHKGKVLSPLSTQGFAVSGILYDTGKGIRLERSNKTSHPIEQMQEAVQGGPFLVERAKSVSGLNDTRKANRTFVATDGRGGWCLGVTRPMTLRALSLRLAKPGALGRFHVETALNLDGGTSSALWDGSNGRNYVNFKPVRNYVGITPRKSAPQQTGKSKP